MSEDKALRRAQAKLSKALEENRDADAIELLSELRRFEPENARWPHKQGELLRQRGLAVQAARCFEKAVALYAKQGFIARAVAMAKTVVELDPSRIEILERIDPEAARQLRKNKRAPRRALLDLDDRPVAALPPAPPRDLLGGGSRAPQRPGPPLAPPPRPDPSRLLGLSLPPRARAKAARRAPSQAPRAAVSRSPGLPPLPPIAARPPTPLPVVRSQRAAPPPPPPEALASPPGQALTLDRLSLPPLLRPRAATARVSLDDLYGRAVRAVPLLAPDSLAPEDENRLSSIPPALQLADELTERQLARQLLSAADPGAPQPAADHLPQDADFASALQAIDGLDVDAGLERALELSEIELSARRPLPALASARPEPPSAATLAELPLFPLFAALPSAVLAHIVARSQLIELPHGAYAVRKDDPGDALYGIVEGSVNVAVPGQAFELTLAEGDVFGETCLLEEAKSQVDVAVMGQLSALRIPRHVLLEGVEQHPPLAGLVLELLTRRLLGNLLQVSALFQDFDAAGKAELARLFEVRRAGSGTLLAAAGKRVDGLYISLTGTLTVQTPEAPVWSAPPGSMFGQSSLLAQAPSHANVWAAVDMIVLRLPSARFAGIAMQFPTVLARLTELSTDDVVRVML